MGAGGCACGVIVQYILVCLLFYLGEQAVSGNTDACGTDRRTPAWERGAGIQAFSGISVSE